MSQRAKPHPSHDAPTARGVDAGGLDERQRAAVDAPGGPLLILAGAGSGKTRVLTARAAALVAGDTAGRGVLVITFTNRATEELRARLGALTGAASKRVTVGTFHAVCHRLCRDHAERIARSPRFSVYDGAASRRLVTAALTELGVSEEEGVTAALVGDQIARAKARLVDPAGYAQLARSPRAQRVAHAFAAYQRALAQSDALDFDDLLCEAVALLGDPVLAARCRRRWPVVLVDEYQDTNPAQEEWLRRLGGAMPNVTVVGDPQQAIYGFRGAEVDNILSFAQRLPGTREVRLERNYRSSGAIVASAARLGAHAVGGGRVRMWTSAPSGPAVTVSAADDERQEAQRVATWCCGLLERGVAAGEIAVLFRTRAQARPLEDSLLAAGMSCRVVGGQGLWETASVRDLIAHLTLLCNPRDQLAAQRALDCQPGVGAVTVARVLEAAERHDGDLVVTCRGAEAIARLSPAQTQAVTTLGHRLAELRAGLHHRGLGVTATQTVLASGLAQRLRAEGGERAADQLEALRRLCRNAKEFERTSEDPTLTAFLAHGALAGGDSQPDDERVTLATLHAAKGAEWDHVRIVGLCEGLLPHHRSVDAGQIDEERRLAYVGLTRARHELSLSWTQRRAGRPARMSRFVTEAGLALRQPTTSAQRDNDVPTGAQTAHRAA